MIFVKKQPILVEKSQAAFKSSFRSGFCTEANSLARNTGGATVENHVLWELGAWASGFCAQSAGFPKHPRWAATAAEPTGRESSGRPQLVLPGRGTQETGTGGKFKGAAVWNTFKEEDNSDKQCEAKEQLDSGTATPAQHLEQQVHLAMMTEQFLKSQSGELVQEWKKRACKKQLNAKNTG